MNDDAATGDAVAEGAVTDGTRPLPGAGGRAAEPGPVAYGAVVAALAALALVAIWAPAVPAGTDLPTHLYFARAVAAPESFGGLVEVHYPPTAQLWVWLVAPLTGFGPVLAARVGLTFLASVVAFGFWAVGRASGDRRPLALLFGLAATQSWFGAMGFVDFVLGGAIGLVALAFGLRAWRAGGGRWYAALAATMLLSAHAHVMAAGLVGLHVALLALLWPGGERARRVAATVASLAPAGVFSLVVAWAARSSYEAEVAVGLSTQRLALPEALRNVWATSFGGFASYGVVVLLAGAACAVAWARSDRRRWLPLGVATLVWAAAYAVVPYHGWGWAYAQPRVLWCGVFATLALVGWGPRPRLTLWVIGALAGVHLSSSALGAAAAGRALAEQLEGFRAVAADADAAGVAPGRTMEVVLGPGVAAHAGVQPLLHAGKYALFNGGVSPLLPPHSPSIHSVRAATAEFPPHTPMFVYRALECSDAAECARAARTLQQRVAVQGLRFDTVTLVGTSAAQAEAPNGAGAWSHAMREAGYEALAPAIWRPRPAALRIALEPPPEGVERALIVRVGYPDGFGWVTGARRAAGPTRPAPEALTLQPLPAGEMVLELALAPSPTDPTERVVWRGAIDLEPGVETTIEVGASR